MITECPHGMPTPKACTDCMMDGPVEAPQVNRPVKGMRVWPARFEGWCSADCEDRQIKIGERIALMSNGTYCHESCVDEWEG